MPSEANLPRGGYSLTTNDSCNYTYRIGQSYKIFYAKCFGSETAVIYDDQ